MITVTHSLAFVLLQLSAAQQSPLADRTYVLQVGTEASSLFKQLGYPAPAAQYRFKGDDSFEFELSFNGGQRSGKGTYVLNGSSLALTYAYHIPAAEQGPALPSTALLGENTLVADGLTYRLIQIGTEHVCDLPGSIISLKGDPSARWSFSKEGLKYRFAMHPAFSEGTFKCDGQFLNILVHQRDWIDGDPEAERSLGIHECIPPLSNRLSVKHLPIGEWEINGKIYVRLK